VSASWRLKVERAKHHFQDLKSELAPYTHNASYELIAANASPKCKEHDGACWDYILRMDSGPVDPRIALIAGDTLANLRSALDHIASALVPSRQSTKVYFPLEHEPIWEQDDHGFVVPDSQGGRGRWSSYTQSMPKRAVVTGPRPLVHPL
jgi:hypothetical protein